jgi:hypothetical protein
MRFRNWSIALVGPILAAAPLEAQSPPLSQRGTVSQTINTTVVSVTWDRPTARGRKLFAEDGVVLPGAIWTPGANRATILEFSRDVRFEGQPVPAGKYSVWTITSPSQWTLILNRRWDVHHSVYPGEADDQLRVTVNTAQGEHMEALAWYFPAVSAYEAVLRIHWGTTVLPARIEVSR